MTTSYLDGFIGALDNFQAQKKPKKKFFLIDGHSQIYRAFYAQMAPLRSPDGEPTKATFVFFRMLLKLVKKHNPDFIVMAVDGKRSELERKKWFPPYKEGRGEIPEEFLIQVKRIKQLTSLLGVQVVNSPGWEADDVIATLCDCIPHEKAHVTIVSRDNDLHQLVWGGLREIYDPQSESYCRIDDVMHRWRGVQPCQIPDVKALCGDSSDNVPGVPGIGPKRASDLIHEYGDIAGVKKNVGKLSQKMRESIEKTDLDLMLRLVTLNRNAPLVGLDQFTKFHLDLKTARPLLQKLGFVRFLDDPNFIQGV